MFGDGLEKEVLISVLPRTIVEYDGMFGESHTRQVEFDRLVVWANRGFEDAFKKVPGVMTVSVDKMADVRYVVTVDPRYNLKWVMAEIEATAKTTRPRRRKTPKQDELPGSSPFPPGLTAFMFGSNSSNPDDDS
jgi:hypothetical protein